jgi:hypothetical protein
MSGRTEIERALDGFLAEGPDRVADPALVRALHAVDRTKQRRDLLAPWRLALMSINSRLAAAMVVAVLAVGGGAYLLGQRSAVGNSSATPTVAPATASPAPSLVPAVTPDGSLAVSTLGWIPFTSSFYGFTVAHPLGWHEQPGSGHWSLANQDEGAVDFIWSPSGWPDFTGYESKVPAGMTADEFIEAYTSAAYSSACFPSATGLPQMTIDGHAATVAYGGCNEHFYFAEATVVVGDRVWFFDLHGPDRSLIAPFLSTVKIDPTTVVD